MDYLVLGFLLVFQSVLSGFSKGLSTFDHNYNISFGHDHVEFSHNPDTVQLSIDNQSGSGIMSKSKYASGFFSMRMKLPNNNDSLGIVTTFYVTSNTSTHDELDLEFLGNNSRPFLLQTNVFVNGKGDREQRIALWFDPSEDFHYYQILWNQHHIVIFVDEIPVRVYNKNNKIGVDYPTEPMMVQATIWTGEWASNGKPINWANGPFKAEYQEFGIEGCLAEGLSADPECYSHSYWWNRKWELDPYQAEAYKNISKYFVYDYCKDPREPVEPPECKGNHYALTRSRKIRADSPMQLHSLHFKHKRPN